MMSELTGARIHITGIVQGVGFRPFVYGLATRLGIKGWVRNTSAGVDIHVDGTESSLEHFANMLRENAPPLALIDSLEVDSCSPNGFSSFEIIHSEPIPGAFQPISPDVSICDDCLRELFDPEDNRYLYPFINCTNCGPRLTIIEDIPYDRPKTTMSPFEMCAFCRSEYEDPLNRRFHAQPVACAECGPHVRLEAGKLGDGILGNWETGKLGNGETGKLVNGDVKDQSTNPQSTNLPIPQTQQLLANGSIVAIKGLGGFHLACDATNTEAVAELRRRKLRVDKPFALMMPDIETVEQHCYVNAAERELLKSRQRPIVLLWRRPESNIAKAVAPNQKTLGVMLPYTPLHYLLFHDSKYSTLVMTSGNISEEPIATDNDAARERLGDLADAFLMHNRDIHVRCDDSVVRVVPKPSNGNQPAGIVQSPCSHPHPNHLPHLGPLSRPHPSSHPHPHPHPSPLPGGEGTASSPVGGGLRWGNERLQSTSLPITNSQPQTYQLRRSRGYVPYPISLSIETPPLLATGAELKNTFCLTKGRYAFLSHHIGNLENYETLRSFEDGIEHFERLFRIQPEVIACDMHPNYLATRYAVERSRCGHLPIYHVQHHHAHIAACMAEHGLTDDEAVIGVSFDGTGYGDDGAIWGGEFLLADYNGYHRCAHLAYTPLPGGDLAIKEPWRMALSWLHTAGIEWAHDLLPVQQASSAELDILRHQITIGLNAPPTSSLGRLFDAVSALVGVRQGINYEAQAAIELEAIADASEAGYYPIPVTSQFADMNSADSHAPLLFQAILSDIRANVSPAVISARFHNGLAQMVIDTCSAMRAEFDLNTVALSGGVWQNMTLLTKTLTLLDEEGFEILIHSQVPANDGGLSLGQAVIAAHQLK